MFCEYIRDIVDTASTLRRSFAGLSFGEILLLCKKGLAVKVYTIADLESDPTVSTLYSCAVLPNRVGKSDGDPA